MKNLKSLMGMLSLCSIFFLTGLNHAEAQSCNTWPTAAGFHTAGGFGNCAMTMRILYDCGGTLATAVCNLQAGGDGFDLPGGCCIVSVTVVTPQQGAYTLSPSNPNINVPIGGWIHQPNVCDDHPVTNLLWDFPMGPCQPGSIHIN